MTKVDSGQVVAVMAEGKEHAVAIGLMKMSSEELLAKNKGIGLDNIHYLNDGLWLMKAVKWNTAQLIAMIMFWWAAIFEYTVQE